LVLVVVLVETLMDGVNLNSEEAAVGFLLRMSERSVVSSMKSGFVEGVLVTENIGRAADDDDADDDPWDELAKGDAGACDSAANEKGSDLVFVGSTSNESPSVGTTRSGRVPPMFETMSRVISILFTAAVDADDADAGDDAEPDRLRLIVFRSADDEDAAGVSKLISLIPFMSPTIFEMSEIN
jgi:hypothetical protein